MNKRTVIWTMIFLMFLIASSFSSPRILAIADSMIIPNAFALDDTKNRLYAGYSNGRCGVWNIATGKLEDMIYDLEVNSSIASMALSNERTILATGHKDGTMEIWNLDPNRKYGEFIREGNTIWDIVFSESDGYVYTANADGRLRIWNIDSKILESIYTRHRRTINSARFSPDRVFLATGSSDNSIILWRVAQGEIEHVMKGHDNWVTSLAFSPNGKYLISGSADKKTMVWAIPRGYMLRESQEFPSEVWSVDFISNEEVVIGEASGDLSLWNMETARETRRVKQAHQGSIRAITYSEKLRQIFTASNDGTIKIWDSENLNLIATFVLANNGEWISHMPLGKYVSSVNALTRNDFYINENGQTYTFERYNDFLTKTEYLPIGDIFGPQVRPLILEINPRNNIIELEITDDSKVKTVEDFNNVYNFDAQRVTLEIPFDIWERDSSIIDIRALDMFGNETREQFEVEFSGFRFYLKQEHQGLEKNSLVVLKKIKDGLFSVESSQGKIYDIDKELLILSPYAPDIELSILYPDKGWTRTKSGLGTDTEEIIYSVQINDIIGVDEIVINQQSIDISNPVKRFESTQFLPLTFGLNNLTITATNMEQISGTASLSLVRTEKIPPEIFMPVIPDVVYSDTYKFTVLVRDNFEVEKLLVNNVNYKIHKKEEKIELELPVMRGENHFEIKAFDWFNNSAQSSFVLEGARVMYVSKEGVKFTDSKGEILDVLMMGDTITTFEEAGKYYRAIHNDKQGLILSGNVQDTPPDIYEPVLANLTAKIKTDHILVSGIACDDVSIKQIIVSGNYVMQTRETMFQIPGYPVRVAQFFEYRLQINEEEIFPVTIEITDGAQRKIVETVMPRL